MPQRNPKSLRLSEKDLDFLVETTHPEATDKLKLKQIIREGEGFRNTFMLSSFTRMESYSISFRVREGIWEKVRFNDLDIFSLITFSEVVEEEYRFGFYKRIADICLFILGIFPEYAEHDYRYPFSGHLRPQIRGKVRISPEDYEKEGRKFYKSAAEHQAAKELDLFEVFWTLHENFQKAKKPLNFIAEHYLQYKRHKLFG